MKTGRAGPTYFSNRPDKTVDRRLETAKYPLASAPTLFLSEPEIQLHYKRQPFLYLRARRQFKLAVGYV